MTSNIPDIIKFQVLADDRPIEGMLCKLTAETNYKNSFNSILGPSDKNGYIIVTRQSILSNAIKDVKLFLMDYGNPLECITGDFTLTPMTISSLNGATKAYSTFHKVYDYPLNYLESIKQAIQLLSKKKFCELSVTVISVEGLCNIKTVTRNTNDLVD